jgi:hypothetical protein
MREKVAVRIVVIAFTPFEKGVGARLLRDGGFL